MHGKTFFGTNLLIIPKKFTPFRMPRPELRAPFFPSAVDLMAVEVTYEKKHAIAKAIKQGHFGRTRIMISPGHIPAGGCGTVRRQVREWGFDIPASVHNALHVIVMTNRLSFADPLTALAVAHDFPRRQYFHELVTFFHDHRGCMYHLVMRDDEGMRELEIDRVSMHHKYDLEARFLTILSS
jgi:hypothetical protein